MSGRESTRDSDQTHIFKVGLKLIHKKVRTN